MDEAGHFRHSSYRESLIEHLFLSELMQEAWRRGGTLEVCKPQVDSAGYDLVVGFGAHLRFVQLKATLAGGAAAAVPVNLALAGKPGGCVIWLRFQEREGEISLGPFLWYGRGPGETLAPEIFDAGEVRHSRANAQGKKALRPGHRRLRKGLFTALPSIQRVFDQLFPMDLVSGAPQGDGR